jgi:hypothetical protein
MKIKFLIIVSMCFFAIQIKAQNFKYNPFKVDITTGVAASRSAVGFAISVEPKYNFSNSFSAGLRWESAEIYSLNEGSGSNRTFGPNGWVNSFVFVGEFYAWENLARPFIGGGTGLYLANFDVSKNQNVSSKMGFALRGGFQIGHLRLVAENNFIPDESYNLNYFNFKIGATLGGGKK